MLYLLDTSVLIEAKNFYYEIDRIPHFWFWILHHARQGAVKIPTAVLTEIRRGYDDDPLLEWVDSHRDDLELSPGAIDAVLARTLTEGYGFAAQALANEALPGLGADPFLIASALEQEGDCSVVTLEKGSITPANLPLPARRKIPLVCHRLRIRSLDTFDLIRELDFRIPLAS